MAPPWRDARGDRRGAAPATRTAGRARACDARRADRPGRPRARVVLLLDRSRDGKALLGGALASRRHLCRTNVLSYRSVQIRAVEPGDIGFLSDMLCEAAAWRTGEAEAVCNHLGEPHLARYLDGWGRRGDRGVVAIDESGRRVGAAWYRLFAQDDRGY